MFSVGGEESIRVFQTESEGLRVTGQSLQWPDDGFVDAVAKQLDSPSTMSDPVHLQETQCRTAKGTI